MARKYDFSAWKQLARVSCFCPTFAREDLLEEAIESFLRQDYEGKKELIVLNDYECQHLVFDHPEVQVHNWPKRFETVGEKFNTAVKLCNYGYVMPWPDDDISLPHRISTSVSRMGIGPFFMHPTDTRNFQFYAPGCQSIWIYDNDEIEKINDLGSYNHGAVMYSKKAWAQAGGYLRHYSNCGEMNLEDKLRVLGYWSMDADMHDAFFIYRKFKKHPRHFNNSSMPNKENTKEHLDEVQARFTSKAPTGVIALEPHWEREYG